MIMERPIKRGRELLGGGGVCPLNLPVEHEKANAPHEGRESYNKGKGDCFVEVFDKR